MLDSPFPIQTLIGWKLLVMLEWVRISILLRAEWTVSLQLMAYLSTTGRAFLKGTTNTSWEQTPSGPSQVWALKFLLKDLPLILLKTKNVILSISVRLD